MQRSTEFLSPAYYTSMGFGVPAAVGASMANPDSRIVVIVGDGAFQMTGMELSTIFRHGLNPIVVILNNHGYTTERFLLEGPFNDIGDWKYHKVPEVLGGGVGSRSAPWVNWNRDSRQRSRIRRALACSTCISTLTTGAGSRAVGEPAVEAGCALRRA